MAILAMLIIVWRTSRLSNDKARLENTVAKRTAELKKSLEQRDVLLKEIHHRVKNNLQVISSLFELQSATITDEYAKQMLEEGRGRVSSIALLHNQLYQQEDFEGVNFNKFVNDLYEQVLQVYKKDGISINFETQIPDYTVHLDAAIPLGLILNELFTNAFKYALYKVDFPKLTIIVKKVEQGWLLTYMDNGPGLPKDFDWRNSRSLGIRMIKQLSKQIEGKMEYRFENGSCFDINFKDR